jgi:hypothetical protein
MGKRIPRHAESRYDQAVAWCSPAISSSLRARENTANPPFGTGVSPAYYRFFPFPAPAKPPQRAKKAARIRDLEGKLGYRPDPTLAALACPSLREGRFWSVLFAGIRLIRGFVWNGRGLPLLQRMDALGGAELYQSLSEMRLSEVLL